MAKFDISLDDKYDLSKDRVYITGTQALIRLCLEQSSRDRAKGLKTGGFITGYRGSPVGAVDFQFNAAEKHLAPNDIKFEAGLNEDLAATALWGAQQAELRGDGAFDGVFGMWYGKGPGVDRSGDAFRHANLAGTSPHGGVLLVMGDDHTCESSTTAHQSEYGLVDAQIPILNPATVTDILEYGLYGWALSRYAGVWCGLKAVKENIESSGSFDVNLNHINPIEPDDFDMPDGGLNIRLNDHPTVQETRLHQHKLDAVRAWVRANKLNKITHEAPFAKLGVIAAGKSYLDVLQAFDELGIDDSAMKKFGIRVMKLAMTWPLEPESIKEFAKGLKQIIVVEEKRGLIEDQLRAILYDQPKHPSVVGKKNEAGSTLFPAQLALNPVHIASEIGARLPKSTRAISARLQDISQRLEEERADLPVQRGVSFCAGCPHNSSTKVPDGARSFAGIGCHYMAQIMDRGVEGYTHMGAEGANWIGEARFSTRDHAFQNIGDGTYNHSGIQAIRAAIGSGVNMTYKVLYNDAVAMTGGQTNDGGLDAGRIAAELLAAGVSKLVYVTEDPGRIDQTKIPGGVNVHHRDELMRIQKEMQSVKGISVILYDQTCATEKRRRRKRGLMADEPKRVFINSEVCEGCGDCGVQSNCVAIQPLETPLGRKRKIDQNACNKDFSCLNGFCPSFVTLEGAEPRVQKTDLSNLPDIPEPANKPLLNDPYSILINGIGGTGVVTVGAIVGMAAHLEGYASGLIDMAGLAQKGGSVFSHVKLAKTPQEVKAIRVRSASADLLLGCDLLISSTNAALTTLHETKSHAVVNSHEQLPGDFARSRDFKLPHDLMEERIKRAVAPDQSAFVNATAIATQLLGDSIGANMFMLGVAYQRGLVPLSASGILRALELNGVAVEMNQNAFRLGRLWQEDADVVLALLPNIQPAQEDRLDSIVADRSARLTAYQNEALAKRYQALVKRAAENHEELGMAVARYYFKLLAYKDEYEVARLYTDGDFAKALDEQFAAKGAMKLHLAPPIFSRKDPLTNRPIKKAYGPWILRAMGLLAKGKVLRGTALDIFGYGAERKAERALIGDYEKLIERLIGSWGSLDVECALELASLPNEIRGFGPVKEASIAEAEARKTQLLERLNAQDNIDQIGQAKRAS